MTSQLVMKFYVFYAAYKLIKTFTKSQRCTYFESELPCPSLQIFPPITA